MFSVINRKIKRMVLRYQKSRPLIRISDTTLRDGMQTPGVSLEPGQKVTIAQALADAGIHSIDCGFPAAGPIEMAGVKAIARQVDGPILTAHSRTKREDIDAAAEALAGVSPLKKAITLFVGVSPLHREHKHNMTRAQVIKMLVDAVEYAGKHFEVISFGPEDASRAEPDFLAEIYEAAIQAGCLSVGYTDTVGSQTPDRVTDAIKHIQDNVKSIDDSMIAVHFHNDLGLATANALAAIKAGANVVQGTINGIGERAGNTAIEEVVVALTLHHEEFAKSASVDPEKLFELSKLIAEMTGFRLAANKPVVGRNIFRTETGVHQNGQLKHAAMYMPFPPAMIGAGPVELVLGPNSGSSAVRYHLEAAGLEPKDEHVNMILGYLKSGQISASDMPEVDGFLERIKPFMTMHERNGEPATS
ncbi:MAG: pyruvate carboxyltransferase [Phycisphaerae bacterium]